MHTIRKQLSLSLALVALLMSGGLLAHPDHKILGTTTMVAADHVMVKDRDGKEYTIAVTKETRATRNKKPMKVADIPVGARVVVTVVSDEDLTAKTIEVGVADRAGGV